MPRCAILALLLIWLPAACTTPTPYWSGSFQPSGDEFETVLASAGDNRAELEAFLSRFEHDPDMARAARSLVAGLPLCDAVAVDADLLSQHLTLAFLARRSMAWGDSLPENVFLHAVLPLRAAQEPAEPWRSRLYGELEPVAASCSFMEEAALAVNRWCASRVAFRPTTGWDLGPLALLRRGLGRCEENAVLVISALRSVAIPARLAMVPAWQHTDGNHAWVEVWIDGEWRYLEPADATASLDQAWFTPSLARAPLVVALGHGAPSDPDAPILRAGPDYAILNTTARHVPVREMSVQVTDAGGAPFSGGKVYLAVVNSGSLRPMLSLDLDEQGRASAQVGPGTILLTAGQGGDSDFALWSWLPGQGAPSTLHDQDAPGIIYMDLGRRVLPRGEYVFRLPGPGPAATTEPVAEPAATPVIPISTDYEPLARAGMRSLGLDPALLGPVTDAAGNAPAVVEAWERTPGQLRPLLLEMLRTMEPKDLAVATSGQLSAEARALGQSLDTALKREDALDAESRYLLLASRQDWEPYTAWRSQLAPLVSDLFAQGADAGLARLNALTTSLCAAKRRDLGHMLAPGQALAAGAPPDPDEAGVLAACLLNAAGIPARFLRGEEFVEYRVGGERLPFFPAEPGFTGNEAATERSAAWFAEPATLRLTASRNNEPLAEDEFAYFQDFTLNRFQDGRLEPVVQGLDLRFDPETGRHLLELPAGNYLLITTGPPHPDERRVHVQDLTLSPGQVLDMDLEMPK